MDPITLAVLTSGVVTLAAESAKGLASKIGEDAWTSIKGVFGWKRQPPDHELARSVAESLSSDTRVAQQVLQLLQRQSTGTGSTLVRSIKADKVVVANRIDTVNM